VSVLTLSTLLRNFLINTSKRGVLLVGLLVAVNALGVPMGPFLTVIGAAGFVVAFALQGTLSNFASGLLLLLYRPFDVGDVVDVAGVTGKVNAMTLMSTSLRTPDNKIVVVPNNSIWGSVITNITGSDTRRVDMVFGIGYDDDIAKAEKILGEIIGSHELVLENPEPVIKLHELADSSVNFVCRPWSKTGDYWAVYWDVTRSVKERFDAEGISIPYPQSDVHMHQVVAAESGNESGSENGAADRMKGGAEKARK
jgi:small conductance mechanosensitive channel